MGVWHAHVNINEIVRGAQDSDVGDPQVVQKAAQDIADRLSVRLPSHLYKSDEIQGVIGCLREVQHNECCCADDLDDVLAQLQGWADYYRIWLGI